MNCCSLSPRGVLLLRFYFRGLLLSRSTSLLQLQLLSTEMLRLRSMNLLLLHFFSLRSVAVAVTIHKLVSCGSCARRMLQLRLQFLSSANVAVAVAVAVLLECCSCGRGPEFVAVAVPVHDLLLLKFPSTRVSQSSSLLLWLQFSRLLSFFKNPHVILLSSLCLFVLIPSMLILISLEPRRKTNKTFSCCCIRDFQLNVAECAPTRL